MGPFEGKCSETKQGRDYKGPVATWLGIRQHLAGASQSFSLRVFQGFDTGAMDWIDVQDRLWSLVLELWGLLAQFPLLWIFSALHLLLWSLAVLHALLYKRDPRAALGWIAVSLLFPLFGPVMYYVFGINRIATSARQYEADAPPMTFGYEFGRTEPVTHNPVVPVESALVPFVNITDRVGSLPLTSDNRIRMLVDGGEAYVAMLRAINAAGDYIVLTTYIFDSDATGRQFIDALGEAVARGVKVWVMLDGIGAWYSWPRADRLLKGRGARVARFLPPQLLPPQFYLNLRNHRKILVVDGKTGFTGGMNIGGRHLVDEAAGTGTADLHFAVEGPAVEQLCQVFAEDWLFTTGESLELQCPPLPAAGDAFARCIRDGPNEDMDKIQLTVMGAITAATRSVLLITPYFLPPASIVSSLQAAALRGVDVAVLLPERSNLRYVDWATRNLLLELMHYGVNIYYQPQPFAHTKLLIVDEHYAQIGSANIDPRSLRLNFELNMEVLGAAPVSSLATYADQRRQRSRLLARSEIENRSLLARIRDAIFWLFSPYL